MADPAEVKAKLRSAFRDFRVDGVPASGANEPVKPEARAGLDALVDLAAQSTVTKAVATKAGLATIPSPAVGDSARVTSDPLGNVANGNGVWSWNGAAWSWIGPWVDPGIQSQIDYGRAAEQGVNSTAFSEAVLISNSGAAVSHSGFRTSGFLKVEGGVAYVHAGGLTGTAWNAWYDANQVFISAFRGSGAGTDLEVSTHTSPNNARFVRVSTSLLALPGAYFRPVAGRLSVDQVKRIAEQHPPVLPASTVQYDGDTVEGALTQQEGQILALQGQLSDLVNELDIQADAGRPLFILTSEFTKSYLTAAPVETISIISRDSAAAFTVANGQGAKLAEGGAVVVHDATADRYHSYGIKSVVGDVITVYGELPATCTTCETMHEANTGQHLGRHGYKGLAEFIVAQSQKYAYRKDKRLFTYHPPACTTPVHTNPHIYDRATGLTKLIDVTRVGGSGAGGYVAGTGNLVRGCSTSSADVSLGPLPLGQILTRFYAVQDSGAGKGIEMSFPTNGVDGFIQIAVSAARVTYDTTKKTEGRVRLEVIGDGAAIFDKTYEAGVVHVVNVDFSAAQTILIRMTLADNMPTAARLHYVYAYQKSPETSTATIFQNGDVVAFLGDSWTQFPNAVAGETKPLRPDGSPADGMQFLSERLRQALAAEGVAITTLNYGKGGTTSKWGRYWVDSVLGADPKPTHCVVNFAINDRNSISAPASEGYDFSPSNMWSFQPASSGGVDGRIGSVEDWLAAMAHICQRLARAGVRPIVLLPPHTGSVSQAYTLQRDFLARLSAGFSTPV